jgi:hypothetical protein
MTTFSQQQVLKKLPPHLHQESSRSHPADHPSSASVVFDFNVTNPASINASEDHGRSGSELPSDVEDDVAEPDLDNDEIAWLNLVEHDELAKCLDTCVDRWRNAGPEARKKMFALFAIAGIFLVVCRYGHVLVICDMIRSGEL